MRRAKADMNYPQAVPAGFNSPSGIPMYVNDTMAKTREPPKTKAELREMLAEAVRNTQPEAKRQSKAKRDKIAARAAPVHHPFTNIQQAASSERDRPIALDEVG